MKAALQLTTRNMSLSEAARATIEKKAEKLEALCSRITACRYPG